MIDWRHLKEDRPERFPATDAIGTPYGGHVIGVTSADKLPLTITVAGGPTYLLWYGGDGHGQYIRDDVFEAEGHAHRL